MSEVVLLPNTGHLQQVEDYVRGCTLQWTKVKTIYKFHELIFDRGDAVLNVSTLRLITFSSYITDTATTEAMNWLESQGITMITTSEGGIISSAIESGQSITLTGQLSPFFHIFVCYH